MVAGAAVQHLLHSIQRRRAAQIALQVLKIDVAHNQEQITHVRAGVAGLRNATMANQVQGEYLFFGFTSFNYSAFTPLVGAGYFNLFLGTKHVAAYLAYTNFFQSENASSLSEMLRRGHSSGAPTAFLNWLLNRVNELSENIGEIEKLGVSRWPLSIKVVAA